MTPNCRADLGAADVRDLVIVSGPDMESILRSAERAGTALQPLGGGKGDRRLRKPR